MRRRKFIAGLGSAAAWPLVAQAQQPALPVIGFLSSRVRALQLQILRLQAEKAAEKIGLFIKEIENQMGWTTQFTWSSGIIEQRRLDGLRLLRQVPAISAFRQLDASGRGRLSTERLRMDLPVDYEHDYSHDPLFTEAVAKKVYYGPVYFKSRVYFEGGSPKPYMTLSVAGTRLDAGVSVAEINLKLLWDVVSQIKVGEHGQAYVIDADGRLIAHSDISLVLSNADMTQLAQVRAARTASVGGGESVQEAKDIFGRDVLTAYARVAPPFGWRVFVELPIEEVK